MTGAYLLSVAAPDGDMTHRLPLTGGRGSMQKQGQRVSSREYSDQNEAMQSSDCEPSTISATVLIMSSLSIRRCADRSVSYTSGQARAIYQHITICHHFR
jgi:hypothetical protein